MSRRIVIGKRNNGEDGVFIAKAGQDAHTMSDDDLLLSATSKISSLLLMGYIASTGNVALGFGAKPIVILSSLRTVTSKTGLVRPSPLYYAQLTTPTTNFCSATVASDGSSMYVVAPIYTRYDVYNEGGI